MYDKKYRLEKIEEFNHHNPIYDNIEDAACYLAYFKVGERGWFLWLEDFGFKEFAHRIHTSLVQSVEYIDDMVVVGTENTKLTFREIKE